MIEKCSSAFFIWWGFLRYIFTLIFDFWFIDLAFKCKVNLHFQYYLICPQMDNTYSLKMRKQIFLDIHIYSCFLMDVQEIQTCMEAGGIFCIIRTARVFLQPETCWNNSSWLRRKSRTGSFGLCMGCHFAHHIKKKKDASVFSDSLTLSPCSAVSALPVMSISTNITGVCSFAANLPHSFINATLMAVPAIMTCTSRGWCPLKAWVDYLSLKESFSILSKLACSQQQSTKAYHRQHTPSHDSAL